MTNNVSALRRTVGLMTLRLLCAAAVVAGVLLVAGWRSHGERLGEILAGVGAIGCGIGLFRFSGRR